MGTTQVKTCFYTICDDAHWKGARGDEFVKSFEHFHPDIPLKIFDEAIIKTTFSFYPELNFYNCKSHFARVLGALGNYDLIVNIDADHLILAPLTELLAADYDVAAPATFNTCANIDIKMQTETVVYGEKSSAPAMLIPPMGYYQGGLIASTSKEFWNVYDYASRKHSMNFPYKENDVLNLVMQIMPLKTKFLEGHADYRHPEFTCYYGCASLGREKEFYIQDNKVMLDGKQVKAYHFAWGGPSKKHPKDLFTKEVVDFIYDTIIKP